MKSRSSVLITALGSLLISACSVAPPKVPGSASRVKVEQWSKLADQGMEESKKPTKFLIPEVFISNAKAARKSAWMAGPEGRYRVSYWDFPGSGTGQILGVTILASPTLAPVLDDAPSVFSPSGPGTSSEEKRAWYEVEVPGLRRRLRYSLLDFAFGDTSTTWNSEIFTVTAADGRQGSYQISIECEDADPTKAQFAKLRVR